MDNFNLEKLKILFVDDNQHMRALVKTVLRALGVKDIKEASDGDDALLKLRDYPADIVICDWAMQPLDGVDFTRRIRTEKDSPNPYVAVILLTGHTEEARVMEARDAGIDEFLAKPVTAGKLYQRICSVIGHRRPFVNTDTYFGPNRRRRDVFYKGTERRDQDPESE